MRAIVKSQETREGVRFRAYKDNKFVFLNVKFENYFYLKTEDYSVHEEEYLKYFNFCTSSVKEVGKFAKVFLSNNFMRTKIRKFWEERCHTFEADIMANKRFLLDNNEPLNNTVIPYTFYDIETDDRKPLQKDDRGIVKPGDSKILSFSAVDYKGEVVYYVLEEYTDAAEMLFLMKIISYFSNYGIISGWYCLDENTKVYTKDGYKKLKNVNIGDKIIGYDNKPIETKILNKRSFKAKNILEFKTYLGKIKATEEHRFFVYRPKNNAKAVFKYIDNLDFNKDVELIESKDLKLGDYLLYPKRNLKTVLINNIKEDYFYLMGFAITDGTLGKKRISFYNRDLDILNYISAFFSREIKNNKVRTVQTCLKAKKLYDLLKTCNIEIVKSIDRNYNFNNILQFSEKQIGAFIAGLIDGDGCVNHFGIAQRNKSFKEELKTLLFYFGIHSSISKNKIIFFIYDENNKNFFVNKVLPYMHNKKRINAIKNLKIKKLQKNCVLKDFYLSRINDIKMIKECVVVDIETDCGNFYANNLLSHNSERFDMPYIKGRCDALGVNYQIMEYINHLDYMELFKKYDKKSRPSNSLNAISNEVLKESKIDQAKGGGAIYRTWLNNKEQLKKYNIEDSNLIYKINLKLSFIEVSMKRADYAGCHVRSTMNNSDSGDFLLMREYKKSKIIMPTKPTREEVEQRKAEGSIGGGYTTCFNPGFHKDVKIWDFASEYPSVIQTWNISPETYIETVSDETFKDVDKEKYVVTPSDFENIYHGHRLYLKKEGVIPRVVRNIVENRNKIKYTMKEFKDSDPDKYKQLYLEQYALKTDANSIYGILAFPMSRYYSWELGDSVTTCARATLKACNQELLKWGCKVIGGDTDSTFVLLQDNKLEDIDEKFKVFLKAWGYKHGAVVNKLEFEYEKTFDRMLFVKKKHYAYKIKDKITIKGMEAIKSDTNKVAALMQKEFIHDVLNETYEEKFWENRISNMHVKTFNQELSSDELVLVKALTKMPKDYEGHVIDGKTKKPKIKADGTIQMKAIPAHVKMAERQISQGIDLFPGIKLKYIVIKDRPILAISPEEFAKGSGTFDYKTKKHEEIKYQWEESYDATYYWLRILKPLIKVVNAYHGHIPAWEFNLTKSQYNKLLKVNEIE